MPASVARTAPHRRIAVAVPARDEQARVIACLEALDIAAGHPAVRGCEIRVALLANNCRDATAARARGWLPRHLALEVIEAELPTADRTRRRRAP